MSAGRLLVRRVLSVVLMGSERVTVAQTPRCIHATFQKAGFASMSGGKDTDHAQVSNDEWESKLTPEQYNVTREKGTEPPFTGKYVHHSEKGSYTCVCCNAELFSSSDKFDSGSGWPSFSDVQKADGASNVIDRPDVSHGMVRTEVICKNCDAHLGHVFEDGPRPTGLRYCINSASLGFNKK